MGQLNDIKSISSLIMFSEFGITALNLFKQFKKLSMVFFYALFDSGIDYELFYTYF